MRLDADLNSIDIKEIGKNNKGIFEIDIKNNRLHWFENLNQVHDHINQGLTPFDDGYVSRETLLEASKFHTEEKSRAIGDKIYVFGIAYEDDVIEKNKKFLPIPISNNKGQVFNSIEDAAEYLIKEKIAKGTKKTVERSLRNNLEGKTKKSYGMVWQFEEAT